MKGLWKQRYCWSEKPSRCWDSGWRNKAEWVPGSAPASALLLSLWKRAAPANPPSHKATRNTNGISKAITRYLRELSIRDTDESHRHLDHAPWELKNEKAISFCSRFSKHLEADISLGHGPALLTFLLQTCSLFGSYVWSSCMWHNNNTSGVKKASTVSNSSKSPLWENRAGFSFGHYQ